MQERNERFAGTKYRRPLRDLCATARDVRFKLSEFGRSETSISLRRSTLIVPVVLFYVLAFVSPYNPLLEIQRRLRAPRVIWKRSVYYNEEHSVMAFLSDQSKRRRLTRRPSRSSSVLDPVASFANFRTELGPLEAKKARTRMRFRRF